MDTNLANYYYQLASFTTARRERRKVSDWTRLHHSLSGFISDTVDCGNDCPAKRLLADMTVLQLLATIDMR